MDEKELLKPLFFTPQDDESSHSCTAAAATEAKQKRIQKRPKMKYVWPDETVADLINEVEIRPCIWNTEHNDYKNRSKRNAAWEEISAVFRNKIDVEQLSAKWQVLRAAYRNTSSNARKQGNAGKPRWKFYAPMSFIDGTKSVCSDSNLSCQVDSEDELSIQPSNAGRIKRLRKMNGLKRWGETSTSGEEDADKNVMNEMIRAEVKTEFDPLQQVKQQQHQVPDDVEVFGSYIISNLRKITNAKHRETTQRRLIQLLWECIDQEPIS